jgi:hypothetical protein
MSGKQDEALRQTLELEVIKLAAESSIKITKMTGHCGVIGPFQNKRRGIKITVLSKEEMVVIL